MNNAKSLQLQRDGHEVRSRGFARLRCAYFAQAAESASKYGVGFDCIVRHLWRSRCENPRLYLRSIRHVDDLVLAVACLDDVGQAWADLSDRYERVLIRRCRITNSEIDAVLIVRRLFADLRRQQPTGARARHSSLSGYAGTRPMRLWLHERLEAILTRRALNRMRRGDHGRRAHAFKLSSG